MRESTLAKYLLGEVNSAALRYDLADVVGTNTLRTNENLILDLSDDYEISKEHLICLCKAFLGKEINGDELKAAAFFLLGSDHFVWDGDSKEGSLIAEIIHDWAAPEINYPLTYENIILYMNGLIDGCYPFESASGRAR
jgi:hypothetical protein